MSNDLERRLKDFPAEFPRPDEEVTRRVRRRLRSARRRLGRTTALAVALATALGTGVAIGRLATPASAIEAATFRSVDLTMICSTVAQSGVRELSVGASPRVVTPTWDRPARLSVATGSASKESLAGAEARGSSGRTRGGVWIHRTHCAATQARIPLTRTGLPGSPTLYQRSFECGVPRRVIVRLRAALKTPGPWFVGGVGGELRLISRDVVSAAVAVRTWPGRKPLAFASLDRREQTRLWAASGCS